MYKESQVAEAVHSFPVAVITNYHKLCGWKQHKLIASQSWSQIQNQDVSRATLLLTALGGDSLLAFPSFLTITSHPSYTLASSTHPYN